MNNLLNPIDLIEIVYEDQDIIAVNKPAGVVVNRAQTVKGETLQDWLEQNVSEIRAAVKEGIYPEGWMSQIPEEFSEEFGSPQEIFLQRSGIAHRLDKDTSGILLVAKHPGSLLELLKQFRVREVKKQYVCLTHGKFGMPKGEVSAPIGRRSSNRKLFGIVSDGRPAVTEYEVQKYYPNFDEQRLLQETGEKELRFSSYNGFSLVNCFPKTGRTHQIRVHLAHLAHPIVGDIFYVGKKRRKLDALWCKRHFLHAQTIEFIHPRTKQRMSVSAGLSKDLQEVLSYLQ
ncbi:MAG: pseudouridine synthase [Patescibacteria group bacterium]|nr:MAG: pseudouridine synthase [Patescibacteria group bacterium]